MDSSFAVQALSARYLVLQHKAGKHMPAEVISIPYEIDYEVARLKLSSLGIKYDVLTKKQKTYLEDIYK